jgi:hypothetical protein
MKSMAAEDICAHTSALFTPNRISKRIKKKMGEKNLSG